MTSAFRIASGVVSLAFGLFVAYRVGLVDGLFYWKSGLDTVLRRE